MLLECLAVGGRYRVGHPLGNPYRRNDHCGCCRESAACPLPRLRRWVATTSLRGWSGIEKRTGHKGHQGRGVDIDACHGRRQQSDLFLGGSKTAVGELYEDGRVNVDALSALMEEWLILVGEELNDGVASSALSTASSTFIPPTHSHRRDLRSPEPSRGQGLTDKPAWGHSGKRQ